MGIHERIRKIRGDMSQEKFGARIGMTKFAISNYETGRQNVPDRTINDICREFGVDPNWLHTGEGEPFLSRDDDMDNVLDALFVNEKETAKAVFKALAKMGGNEWRMLKNLILSAAREIERSECTKE